MITFRNCASEGPFRWTLPENGHFKSHTIHLEPLVFHFPLQLESKSYSLDKLSFNHTSHGRVSITSPFSKSCISVLLYFIWIRLRVFILLSAFWQRRHFRSMQQQWHCMLLWIRMQSGTPISLYAAALLYSYSKVKSGCANRLASIASIKRVSCSRPLLKLSADFELASPLMFSK